MKTVYHPFADLIGLEFSEHDAGRSVCSIETAEKLLNPHKVVHGGVLYSLADTGMGAALSSLLDDGESCSTIEVKITYFRPVSTGKITCNSKVIHRGRKIASLESEIFENENLVAKASGSFFIFKVLLKTADNNKVKPGVFNQNQVKTPFV